MWSLTRQSRPQAPRSGATLIEVLMSLMIMGVGITSVIALFPLSMLSSIRATQMTNGKLLEQNVVDLIRTYPQMVEGFPQWQPGVNYSVAAGSTQQTSSPVEGSRVVPSPENGRPLSSTNSFLASNNSGQSGAVEPNWYGSSLVDKDITWTAVSPTAFSVYSLDSSVTAGIPRTAYIVDPLGYHNSTDSGSITNVFCSTGAVKTRFGANYDGTTNFPNALPRLHADLASPVAEKLFSLPDSWQLVAEVIPISLTQDMMTGIWTVKLPLPTDFTSLTGTVTGNARITFLSTDGTLSVTRDLDIPTATTNLSSTSCNLIGTLPGTLDELTSVEIGKVRVETFSRRYSFLLTVIRSSDGSAKVQCPVFFNRSFSANDERAFAFDFDAAATGSARDTFTLNDPNFPTTGAQAPLIAEGHYAYDVLNAQWYKIVAVSGSGTSRTLTVDRTIIARPNDVSTGLMFPTGVVNVFDIEL